MSKILLTGGAGFIGYHLAKLLSREGHRITIVDNRLKRSNDQEFQDFVSRAKIEVKELDLATGNDLGSIGTDFDYIYHLAAIIGVKHVIRQPLNVLQDNLRMFFHLLPLIRAQVKLQRLIFASTSEVYDGTLKYFDLELPAPESAPLTVSDLYHPRTSYMLSKIYGEALCIHSELPYTIIRPFNFYGPRMGMSHVIPEVAQRIYQTPDQGAIDVINLDHTRTFCYIDDAVKMMKLAAEKSDGLNQVLNVGVAAPEVSMGELVDLILKVMDRKITVNYRSSNVGSPARRCPDISKVMKVTGYQPKVKLEEGIRRTCQWYQKTVFENGCG